MTRVLAMFGLLLLPSCKTPATVETREPAEPQSAAVVVVEAQPAETKVVHPPRLEGTYAIERIEYVDGASERPGEHLETDPGYVFGREALVFGATTVRRRYEV